MRARNGLIWVLLFTSLFMIATSLTERAEHRNDTPYSYSQFVESVRQDDVAEIEVRGNHVRGKTRTDKIFVTYAPMSQELLEELLAHKAGVVFKPAEGGNSWWLFLLPWLLPFGLAMAAIFFVSRRAGGAGGPRGLGFGQASAKMAEDTKVKVRFEDVAGVDEAKQELREVVEFLKDPQKFQRLGGKIPRGVLLVGHPGTGKTLLAKAVAGEAGVPFFSMAGSDFVEMFVGVGASRVRSLFEQARKNSPSIIFIDEIDAVGRKRGAGFGGGNEEREQTLNQLLVEMDGFEESHTIIIAATNRPDVLDQALLRPGRFDRRIVVALPDRVGREKILAVHTKKVPLAPNVDLAVLARGTPGFSGAELANLVNEAALLAARGNKLAVGMRELEEAKDKVIMGSERRSMVLTEESRKNTAYHEAGHAVVSYFCPGARPLHKATIIPRGESLGMVVSLPEVDETSRTRESLLADITMSMGGRIAEEMIFGPDRVTTGASCDIKNATSLARRMVTEWGMSEAVGCQTCDMDEAYYGGKGVSEAMAQRVDDEVHAILTAGYARAQAILTEHAAQLEALAKALLERETLSGEEIRKVCRGEPLPEREIQSAPEEVAAPESLPQVPSLEVEEAVAESSKEI